MYLHTLFSFYFLPSISLILLSSLSLTYSTILSYHFIGSRPLQPTTSTILICTLCHLIL